MDAKAKRALAEKVRRRFSNVASSFGFTRTRNSFWTRPRGAWIEFVHLHVFTFGPALRVHLGIRALNDPFEAIAFNGPCSGDSSVPPFGPDPGAVDSCVEGLRHYFSDVGLPWFEQWPSTDLLANHPRSPLDDAARKALSIPAVRLAVTRSKDLLGLQ
jgi:hypothetical protein